MKVITWFYSNSELLVGVIKEEVNIAAGLNENECDEDEYKHSDDETRFEEVISIRLIVLLLRAPK